METEVEAKFPNIDITKIRAQLETLGATLEHPEILMRRKNFDYEDWRLQKIGGWIRVRDEGNKVTMSYKQLNDRTLHGTQEVNLVVDDFDKACNFLSSIGLQEKSYQETKREKWLYKNVEITIDTWPWVPPFIELEGPTEEMLKSIAKDLELDWNQAMHGSVETIYQMHYNFTEEEIDHWDSITFIPEPEWLLIKKKPTLKK
ncbi:MAG TPA: class IV adenylate cyclase [Candidatus Paceibacterota bacterium]|nr:class IV adenylate cyclase [Candidatus Paceibacterota bacterium]